MRIKTFSIPTLAAEVVCDEVSNFIANHRILNIHHNFVEDGPNSHWALLVFYQRADSPKPTKPPKVDYQATLSPDDFILFNRLRDLRKLIFDQEEDKAAPIYSIFTNAQLAQIAVDRVDSLAKLRAISGIGKAKADKYGERFIGELRKALAERGEQARSDASS